MVKTTNQLYYILGMIIIQGNPVLNQAGFNGMTFLDFEHCPSGFLEFKDCPATSCCDRIPFQVIQNGDVSKHVKIHLGVFTSDKSQQF